MAYRIVPHTSEVGLEADGRDLPELFRHAADGLLHLYSLLPSGEKMPDRADEGLKEVRVRLSGEDPGDLLILWLNELVFQIQTRRLRPVAFRFESLTETTLTATLAGRDAPAARDLAIEVKSAARAGALVEKTEKGWTAKVILDV